MIFTVHPKSSSTPAAQQGAAKSNAAPVPPPKGVLSVRELIRVWLSSPTLILLCLAGGVRNAGGYVWAYYTSPFFKDFRHVPKHVFEGYLGLIPLIGGSLVRARGWMLFVHPWE